MEKSRRTKLIVAYLIIALICIGACGLYLFATPDGWISVQASQYNSSSLPPASAAILIPTEQEYQQYPHLKALRENPGANFPISDNPFVRLKHGDSVVSGKEAGELLGKYGMGKGYILSKDRYYQTVLMVT